MTSNRPGKWAGAGCSRYHGDSEGALHLGSDDGQVQETTPHPNGASGRRSLPN